MFKAYLIANIVIIAAGLIAAGITSAWVSCSYFMLAGVGAITGICIAHNAAKKHRWFNLFLGIAFGLGSLTFAGLAAAMSVANGVIAISGFSEFLPYGGMILAGIGLVNAFIDSCRDACKEGKEYSYSFYAFLSAVCSMGMLVLYKALGSIDSPLNWVPILPYIAFAFVASFIFTTLKASATKSEAIVYPDSTPTLDHAQVQPSNSDRDLLTSNIVTVRATTNTNHKADEHDDDNCTCSW